MRDGADSAEEHGIFLTISIGNCLDNLIIEWVLTARFFLLPMIDVP